MSAPPASAPGPFTTPERWTLAATVLGSSMAFIDGTVVNVALNALQRDLNADAAGVQWIVNGYTLPLAALLLAGGALGDLYGRRRMFALGVVVFAVASLLCGLAPNLGVLIAARVLQGVGGALLTPGSLAIIGAVLAPERRGRAIGLWSAATSVVTVLGPVLGGALVDFASWRLVFLINLPLAALTLWWLRGVPETRDPAARRPDWIGAVLATVGLGALAYGLTSAGEGGLRGPPLVLSLAGAAVLAAFVYWQARAREPMLPLGLFRSPVFAGTNLLTLLLYGALGAALFFMPLALIGVFGYSATAAGTALLPLSLCLALLSGVFGGLADRVGPRPFLTFGPILAGVGFALFALPGFGGNYWTTVLPGVLALGLGMALVVAPLVSAVLGSVDREKSGVASGVNNAVSRAAGLLAIAVFVLVMLATFRGGLETRLARADLPQAARAEMLADAGRLAQTRVPEGLGAAPREAARDAVRGAFMDGFRIVCLASAALAVLSGLVGAWSLRGVGRMMSDGGGEGRG